MAPGWSSERERETETNIGKDKEQLKERSRNTEEKHTAGGRETP